MKMAINRRPAARGGASGGGLPSERRSGPTFEERRGDIGNRLRALYAEAEQEPLPAHLIELLEMLDRAESGAGKAQAGENDGKPGPIPSAEDASQA